MNICLFGGSFDPVHAGHLTIATAAQSICKLNEVIFLPAAQSPFKQNSQAAFSNEQRLHMLKLATEDLPWAKVSSLDLELPPPSWSWRIAEYWHQTHPEAQLYWLMGTDQWEQLHRWARFDYLCELLHFIVYHRDTPPQPRPGVRSTFICTGMHPATSSAIREALQNRTPIPDSWLPSRLKNYINLLWTVNSDSLDIDELPEDELKDFLCAADEQNAKDSQLKQEERHATLLLRACELLKQKGYICVESIQRHLYLSYAGAAQLLNEMIEKDIISPAPGIPGCYLLSLPR